MAVIDVAVNVEGVDPNFKGPRRLPMARRTETTQAWRDPKRNKTSFKSKDLVRFRKRRCPLKLPKNWKNQYTRYRAKNWESRYKVTNRIDDVIYRIYDQERQRTKKKNFNRLAPIYRNKEVTPMLETKLILTKSIFPYIYNKEH
ncbi:hypothetical protein HELRODRAFT_165005 [Helobdella robusta]|uniref:Uncharacterized protein n=1 Tax=Helobdella robusta TaxID=6412 RepID=T1EW40_HELRO|nr:hypothetical protein HELRODRAFT_165005 [Helobdella robusta]ESN92871.1 hypothetical protein HELRODRAFT_165005 [Helobdella robusta]